MNRPVAGRRSVVCACVLVLAAAPAMACATFRLPVISSLVANVAPATAASQALTQSPTSTVEAAVTRTPTPATTLPALNPNAGGVIPGKCLSEGAGCPATPPANQAAKSTAGTAPCTADHP